jgi:hypothetical protein
VRLAIAIGIVLAVGACGASPELPASNPATGILVVAIDEQVQAELPTEELRVAFSRAEELADASGADLGLPWFDASTGELVLSAVTPRGRELIENATIAAPHRIRTVTHGATELSRIKDDATTLRVQAVRGAELISETLADQRDNRALLVICRMDQPLLDALAVRYPPDALAIQVDPRGPC